MGLANFFSEIASGRGIEAINKEANRVGGNVKKETNRLGDKASNGIRLGVKVADKVGQFGKKVSDVAGKVSTFTDPLADFTAGIPVVGTATALVNRGVKGVGAFGSAVEEGAGATKSMLQKGDKLIRTGRGVLEAKSGGDLIKTARDIARQGGDIRSDMRKLGNR
jgi:hypothetical protein